MFKPFKIFLFVIAAPLITGTLLADAGLAPPQINAEAAVLIEYSTGEILYQKNPDKIIPPASMTKLMTIHVILKAVGAGKINIDDPVPISESADFRSLPPRSSLMFLEEGQKVTLLELLQGLALPSGNDAGIAAAEYLAGDVKSFVDLMNTEAEALGMSSTHFDDSSGLSEKNRTTAADYAHFCRHYIEKHLEYIPSLHTPTGFTYPKETNLPDSGKSVYGPITQPNHNELISRFNGADGLKTGYIDESGYNLAATAELNGRRLVLVTMGGSGENSRDGSLHRAVDASTLLTYGFYAWSRYTPELPQNKKIEVFGAEKDFLEIGFSKADSIIVKTAEIDSLEIMEKYKTIEFPVKAGEIIGSWELVNRMDPQNVIQAGLIRAAESIEKGNLIERIFQSIKAD